MKDPQRELEHLRKLATADPNKRFGKLYCLVSHVQLLTIASQRVRQNTGGKTAGIDGQTRKHIDDDMLSRLALELTTRCYQPKPVLRKYIPKGKTRKRTLGIPSIRDRIVQAAVAQVLEAIYEPIFRDCSMGFRPGRNPIQALRHVAQAYKAGATWIIELKVKVKHLCGFTQIPELDLFTSVNALMRGWTNYFRYAHNATQRFGYLTGVVYWLGAHYLGRKYRCSIKKVMRNHYGVDPTSGKRALYTSTQAGKCLYIWNKPPRRCSLFNNVVQAKDVQPLPMTSWASGRSYAQRMEVYNRSEQHCEHCGNISSTLIVHHPHRLGKLPKRKKGKSNVIASGQQQKVKLLCFECHKLHHPGGWSGKNKKSETEYYWRAGCSDELPAQF
jgi:hypothetical protein